MPDIIEIKEHYDAMIHSLHNVVGTGIGRKFVNGLPTDQPAIVVFVEKKLAESGVIRRHSAQDLIPHTLENIPTDVIEVGRIVKQRLVSRMRPLVSGYSCGHRKTTAGTIGGFFRDKDNEIVALSNNHVIANENDSQIGDVIYQPGPLDSRNIRDFDGWDNPEKLPYFGVLKSFVKINARNNVQDSAIAKVYPRLVESGMVSPDYPIIGKRAMGWGAAKIGDQIQKCGRTTGHTTGSVLALNGTFTIGYDFGPAEFRNCIVSTFMSRGGDSGSVIYDFNMRAVGLLFAGSDKVTIHNPIEAVRNHYGLEIWDGTTNVNVPLDWNLIPRKGVSTVQNNVFYFQSAANLACLAEKRIDDFTTIECIVNTGTDTGATWGTGLAVRWPNASLKVNLRFGRTFGGYYNNDTNLNIGRTRPNTDYGLKIRKSGNSILGEIKDGNKWYIVVSAPLRVFHGKADIVRIGKTDMRGEPRDHTVPGQMGHSTIREFKIS